MNVELPLATFVMIAYNQEAYVRQAVESALAQTYSPLEIILSDDASSDATASIIKDLAKAYRGPHKVVVNVNAENLGIGAHVNKMFSMAKGRLVILAAGDDRSAPERTAHTICAWQQTGCTASAIYCEGQMIDTTGDAKGLLNQRIKGPRRDARYIISNIHRGSRIVLGACSAYAPGVMSSFGDLAVDLGIEDTPLAVRASLLGGIEYIDDILVSYRVNVSVWRTGKARNETFDQHLRRLAHLTKALHLVFRQILVDAEKSGNAEAIEVANQRYIASDFTIKCHARKRFLVTDYFTMAIRSGEWKNPFVLGMMYSFPKLHRMVFRMRQLLDNGILSKDK